MQTVPDENDSTSTSSSSNNISNTTDIQRSSSSNSTPYVTTKQEYFYMENDEDELGDEDELFQNKSSSHGIISSHAKSQSMEDIDFETGPTLAEELAFVFAQENVNKTKSDFLTKIDNTTSANLVIGSSCNESSTSSSSSSLAATMNNKQSLEKQKNGNEMSRDKEESVYLPHYVNVAEYLGSVVQEMSATPSPSPQSSPQKQVITKAEACEPPVPAAVSNLTVLLDPKPNSSSSSNSNSSTSSVIATPNQSNGNANFSYLSKDKDFVDASSNFKKPAAKNIDLSLNLKPSYDTSESKGNELPKSASMLAFDEKFSTISMTVQSLTTAKTSSSSSSSSSSTSSLPTNSSSPSLNKTMAPSNAALNESQPPRPSTQVCLKASQPQASKLTPELSAATEAKEALESALLHWNDMPKYLQFNPYVLEGYRPLQTFKGCLLSLFWWHNETVNILTHGLPIVYILAIVPGLMPWENGYRFLSFCHVFGSVAPWCGSFIYHLFMNLEMGENIYYTLLKLDMVGIWVSQSFGALPLVTATTFCFSFKWKWLIIISYCLMSLWGLYKALTASSPWQRRLCFALPFGMRTFLTLLRTMGLGGNPVALPHVYLQDGVSVLGGAIGAIRIPEKWFPGLVDYYLNSHNIMHVLVVLAVYSMHQATVKDFEWMSATNCAALSNSTTAGLLNFNMNSHVEL